MGGYGGGLRGYLLHIVWLEVLYVGLELLVEGLYLLDVGLLYRLYSGFILLGL